MNFEGNENSQPASPEKKEYKLDRGYKVFERICENCDGNFSVHVPDKDSNSKFTTESGRKIKIKELEEKAEAQKFCPECENKVVKIVDQKNK